MSLLGTRVQRHRKSIRRAALCIAVMVCGLCLRKTGLSLGLPGFVVKYGGSILWGTMIFFLAAIATPRLQRANLVLLAFSVAVAVELFRLVHTPWLDAFRLTTAGALLLGRIFSGWDIVAYAAGITFGMLVDVLLANPRADLGTSASAI
jgi:uncharacterized protein DUF2809